MNNIIEKLKSEAKQVSKNAYTVYSNFSVGAALLTESGKIYTGVNIENASYGATVCAERNAVFHAVGDGERNFTHIAVYNEKQLPIPCGMCLQVLSEFAPHIKVTLFTNTEEKQTSLDELLPNPFKLV